MARLWKIPLFMVATAYFVVDGLFSYVTRPISAWIGQMRLFERARRWIVSLRPYPSLALFAVPVIILEPVKPLAGYLVATGHLLSGAATFIAGEVVKLTCVERLFELNRTKLLSIPAFATAYGYWRRMMDAHRSDGSLEGVAAACRRGGPHFADALASIQARQSVVSPSIPRAPTSIPLAEVGARFTAIVG